MVSVLDFSDCKTGLFPEKDVLSVQRACAVLSSATCLALPSFSTLSHKREDFRKKKVIGRKMCVSIYSKKFVCNISCYKTKSLKYYHKCT
jgi:hypothetical protein